MSTRERILDAAEHVMRERGAARATTREIARAAGYSEALLYKHFRDKDELLMLVLKERMPAFSMAGEPGDGSVESNLVEVAHNGLRFYRRAFPMMASMVAQPSLMVATREALRAYGAGPHMPVRQVTEYLDAERALGRVASGADTAAVAALLVGACFQQGFLLYFAEGADTPDPPESRARDLVRPLLPALLP